LARETASAGEQEEAMKAHVMKLQKHAREVIDMLKAGGLIVDSVEFNTHYKVYVTNPRGKKRLFVFPFTQRHDVRWMKNLRADVRKFAITQRRKP
jgi:hypothetical protein